MTRSSHPVIELELARCQALERRDVPAVEALLQSTKAPEPG